MAPTTRRMQRVTPPPTSFEADTIKRTRFYDAWDHDYNEKSTRQIARDVQTSEGTARRWLKQRERMGSLAYRSLRKRSTQLGRPSKVTKSMCKMLVDPARNPVRDQLYKVQIEYYGLPVQKRQLQRKLKEYIYGSQRYKCIFVKKKISDKNKAERVKYAQEHVDKSIEDFWSYIFFTDEAYIDPTSQAVGDILRERGTRYNDENIQERGEKLGVRFHVAVWII